MIAEQACRQKALIERLSRVPIRKVLGVVGPYGASGANNPGDDFWTLRFEFENWKFKSESLQNKILSLQKIVSKEELHEIMKGIKKYDILEIETRVDEGPSAAKSEGLFLRVLGKVDSDLELKEAARQSQEPITIEDAQFGVFQLERIGNLYESRVKWVEEAAKLSLDGDSTSESLTTARALWLEQNSWNKRILDHAVNELLKLKNETWLQSDEEDVLPDQFKARMKLHSIRVRGNGDFVFWFEDGDLFWGHDIMVEGSVTDGPTKAGIHG